MEIEQTYPSGLYSMGFRFHPQRNWVDIAEGLLVIPPHTVIA